MEYKYQEGGEPGLHDTTTSRITKHIYDDHRQPNHEHPPACYVPLRSLSSQNSQDPASIDGVRVILRQLHLQYAGIHWSLRGENTTTGGFWCIWDMNRSDGSISTPFIPVFPVFTASFTPHCSTYFLRPISDNTPINYLRPSPPSRSLWFRHRPHIDQKANSGQQIPYSHQGCVSRILRRGTAGCSNGYPYMSYQKWIL